MITTVQPASDGIIWAAEREGAGFHAWHLEAVV